MKKKDYEIIYENCADKIIKEKHPARQFEIVKTCMLELNQTKSTYWPRPCLRNWPCLFTQHRSEIDKQMERLKVCEEFAQRKSEQQSQSEIKKDISLPSDSDLFDALLNKKLR